MLSSEFLLDAGVVNLAETREGDFDVSGVFNWTAGSTGVFNWTAGGDHTPYLTTLAGSMKVNGSAATAADFNIVYDSGVTTMTLLPEPATIFVMAAAGVPVLLKRRRKRA